MGFTKILCVWSGLWTIYEFMLMFVSSSPVMHAFFFILQLFICISCAVAIAKTGGNCTKAVEWMCDQVIQSFKKG